MKTIKIQLDGDPSNEIEITAQNYGQFAAWHLLSEEGEAVLKRDVSGAWMQRSRDNLSPETIAKIGEVIEYNFLRKAY